MSEHHLPDDVAKWPHDPYELLGVVRGATARDIKRAYTQLIRVYKPEHAPEAFRLIREAYENASRMAEYFAVIPTPEPDVGPAESTPKEDPLRPIIPSVDDEIDGFWNEALKGNDQVAYDGLRAMLERFPQRSDLYARLYWLSLLNPNLLPKWNRIDWLYQGLIRCRLDHTLAELYHAECARHEAALTGEQGPTLLQVEAPTNALTHFLNRRWELLLRARHDDAIGRDINLVADRLRADDAPAWLRLMVLLCDDLYWRIGSNDPLRDTVRDELQLLESVALQQVHWFDRLDQLKFLVKQVDQMEQSVAGTTQLGEVVRLSWSRPFEEALLPLEDLLYMMTTNPTLWLSRLYRVAVHASAVLDYFSSLLEQYEGHRDLYSQPSKELWSDAADHVIWGKIAGPQLQSEIFQFCYDRNTDPMMILSSYMSVAINEQNGHDIPRWLQSFIADRTLILLLRACRLFRQ